MLGRCAHRKPKQPYSSRLWKYFWSLEFRLCLLQNSCFATILATLSSEPLCRNTACIFFEPNSLDLQAAQNIDKTYQNQEQHFGERCHVITSLPRAKFNFPWAPGYLWYVVLYKQEERFVGGVWRGSDRTDGQNVPPGPRALVRVMGHPHLAKLLIWPKMGIFSIGPVIHSLVLEYLQIKGVN